MLVKTTAHDIFIVTDLPYRQSKCVITTMQFPGGEIDVTIPDAVGVDIRGDINVVARLNSSDSFIRLAMTTEILRRLDGITSMRLTLPYFPGRQDRIRSVEVGFSAKVYAQMINALRYDRVLVIDPHSDVTAALIDNVTVISQAAILRKHHEFFDCLRNQQVVFVAPDAGAGKKTEQAAAMFDLDVAIAIKHRDADTGELSGTKLVDGDVSGKLAVIIDDICDGGGTFIPLAKALRDAGARDVWLYVTHGLFSKGFDVFNDCISRVFTTDSILDIAKFPSRRHSATEHDGGNVITKRTAFHPMSLSFSATGVVL